MGAAVSDWRLAHTVAALGHIGVISGTALDVILVRRLQVGDPDGQMRRALAAFPDQEIAARILDRYYIPGGKPLGQPFCLKPMIGHKPSRELQELLVASNFVEVFLAKDGHDGLVGVNYLHKIQAPLLPSLYGALMAGVDLVIVGAGIPLEIPGILDVLCRGGAVDFSLHVRDARNGQVHKFTFDPKDVLGEAVQPLRKPLFFPVVSSATLATMLMRKCKGLVDGLIVEEPSAGGHNAPPRGAAKLSDDGEAVYGPRDEIDVAAIGALGLPFWLAGSYGSPEALQRATGAGAAGVQVGTLFAFCDESGLRPDLKRDTIARCHVKLPRVFRDPVASPTGFPFQVLSIDDSLSNAQVYQERPRVCDLGYLREPYERADDTLGWRCPADSAEAYLRTGGNLDETVGRKCICNALMANIGLAQNRDELEELPLVTCGSDLSGLARLTSPEDYRYSAADVIDFLLPLEAAH